MNSIKTILPARRSSSHGQKSSKPALVNKVEPEEIVRAITSPISHTLTPAVVNQLQNTHGNHFVQRLLKQSEANDAIAELATAPYPQVDPNAPNPDQSPTRVVQRTWTTYPLDYTTMSAEKAQGEIRTKAWKIGGGLEDWVTKFRNAIGANKPKDALSALDKLKERLEADKELAESGKLKAPKGIKNFDRQAAQQAAATFFNKWITAVQDHIDYAANTGDWITDFRDKYVHEAVAGTLTAKEAVLRNVAKIENLRGDDLDGVTQMWDLGDQAMQQRMTLVMGGVSDLSRMSRLEYFLEQVSPIHIGYDTVLAMFRHWTLGTLTYGYTKPWETWITEKANDNHDTTFGKKTIVDSYDAQTRAQYQLHFSGKTVLKADNSPLAGDNIFALSKDSIWYASGKVGPVHHSSFMQGAPVKCAGHLYTKSDGSLTRIDNNSGHYAPDQAALKRAAAVLQSQMDVTDVRIAGYGAPKPRTVAEFLKS